jgi:hypothetical protein
LENNLYYAYIPFVSEAPGGNAEKKHNKALHIVRFAVIIPHLPLIKGKVTNCIASVTN